MWDVFVCFTQLEDSVVVFINVLKMSWGLEKVHHHILGNLPHESQIPEESIAGVSHLPLRTEVPNL